MNEEKNTIELNSDILRFIENIAGIYEGYGIPRIGGRIFGLCLVTVNPLSSEKISELLQASRSSISTNIRRLVANGWVKKVTFTGDRTEYYRFCPDAWEHVLEHRKKGLVPLKTMVDEAENVLFSDNPAREQLSQMGEWVNLQIDAHEAMINKWKKLKRR